MPANLKRKSYPFCGRLIVLQAPNKDNAFDHYQGLMAINFPAMPDTIELARRADYLVVTNQVYPDGVHLYKGTSPLEIPIAFSLHSFDRDYCTQGALSLLRLAADLHSLVLPFGPEAVVINVGREADQTAPKTTLTTPTTPTAGNPKSKVPEGTSAAVEAGASQNMTAVGNLKEQYNIYPPATCYLELIVTDYQLPGITCVGYVKDVKVILKGPWLKGPNGSQNLPSGGEFSFTFVHHPGHGNAYNFGKNAYDAQGEQQAMANKVRDRLYNTRDLLTHQNYHGFDDSLDK